MTHGGDTDPTGVIRHLQSAFLRWTKYYGAPLLQPVKDVVGNGVEHITKGGMGYIRKRL